MISFKNLKSWAHLGLTSTLLLALSGCGSEINSDTYEAGTAGQILKGYPGTVVSCRTVTVQHGDNFGDNALGGALGAVVGGVLGNQIGRGKGNTLATVGGAVGGGILGSKIQQGKKKATEYVVELDSGEEVVVVQGPKPEFHPGDRIRVVDAGGRGRSRITRF